MYNCFFSQTCETKLEFDSIMLPNTSISYECTSNILPDIHEHVYESRCHLIILLCFYHQHDLNISKHQNSSAGKYGVKFNIRILFISHTVNLREWQIFCEFQMFNDTCFKLEDKIIQWNTILRNTPPCVSLCSGISTVFFIILSSN